MSLFSAFVRKYKLGLILLMILIFTAVINPLRAATPIINYQGKLTNLDGTNVADGSSYAFKIRFMSALTGGSCLYTLAGTGGTKGCSSPTATNITVTNGVFNIPIGDTTALTGTNDLTGVDFNTDMWMEVTIGTDVLSPRKRITGSAFSFDQRQVRLIEDGANGSNYVGFQAPSALSGNVLWTLPSADGVDGQFLKTNGTGTLSWVTGSSSSALSSITAATSSPTAIDNLTYAQTWNWSTLTTQTALSLGTNTTGATTGGILSVGSTNTVYNPGAGNTGSLATFGASQSGSNTSGLATVNVLNLNSKINTTGATGTKAINALNISAPTLTACTGGSCTWTGLYIADPGTLANTTLYSIYSAGGSNYFGGKTQVAVNGAASAPPLSLTGTWYSGGTSTTTKPQLLIEPTGTTSTYWSTSGTGLGINAPSGFSGMLIDTMVNNSSKFVVDSTGIMYLGGATDCNGNCINGSGTSLGINSGSSVSINSHNANNVYLNTDSRFASLINGSGFTIDSVGATTANAMLDVRATDITSTTTTGTIAAATFTGSITKNNTTTATYPFVNIKPTLATGASNTNTTFNILNLDTTNTTTTGLTTNLIKASYGGVQKFLVDSAGNMTVTSCTGCSSSALSSITAATSSPTAIDNLTYAQTWNWSTLTTQTALSLGTNTTAATTGGILAVGSTSTVYNPGAGGTGSLATFGASQSGSNTSGLSTVNVLNLNSKLNTTGATGTKAINALNISAPTLTACTGGSCTWTGLYIADPGTLANTTLYSIYVAGGNTYLGGNLTVTGTAWTATPTISGLITATSGITSNGAFTVGANQNIAMNSGTGTYTQTYTGTSDAMTLTSLSTTDTKSVLKISQTGATTGTDYGMYVTNTGAGTTNVGGYFSASGATNNYALLVASGSVGVGTTSPNASLDVMSATSPQLRIGYDVSNYLTAGVASNGAVTMGATGTGSKITFTSETDLSGSARHTRLVRLSPEYQGAVLTKFYGAGTDTLTTGAMVSDSETSTGNAFRTYYQWSSTQTSLNYYTVAVRVTLPDDFSDWTTSNAVQIDYLTNSTSAVSNLIDARIYLTSSSTAVYSGTSNVSGTSATWTTLGISKASLTGTSSWSTAGQTAIIYLRMSAKDANFVRTGDITLNYLSKW
ncbi:MAG: hypothetical protein WCJ19_01200 [bacterium]